MSHTKISPLCGQRVQLEPLDQSHKDELYVAAQDESIWMTTATTAYADNFEKWFANSIDSFQQELHLPFVVRRLSDNTIIGSTRYYDISLLHRRLTIGYTWYIPEVWGSYVNPECKFLLLTNAFEILKMNRVEFMTDARNLRSQAAIKKLGAKQEGVLRQHMILSDGYSRDSVIFSITSSEWPSIKLHLLTRLKK